MIEKNRIKVIDSNYHPREKNVKVELQSIEKALPKEELCVKPLKRELSCQMRYKLQTLEKIQKILLGNSFQAKTPRNLKGLNNFGSSCYM